MTTSILAWKIPWTEEPGRLQPMGLQRVGYNWAAEHTHTGQSRTTASALEKNSGALGRGVGADWEFGTDVNTRLYLKQMID